MNDPFDRLDAIHAELMEAYELARVCLEAGEFDAHASELRRALRLSSSYHAEADVVSAITWARWNGGL